MRDFIRIGFDHAFASFVAMAGASLVAVLSVLTGQKIHAWWRHRQGKPLCAALGAGDLDTARHLIDTKCDVNIADQYGRTPLSTAVREGHVDIVQALIGAKANVNQALNSGRTPLIIAIQNEHTECLHLLIAAKADVNQRYEPRRMNLAE